MNSGMRSVMYSLWSSSAAVTPPTWAVMPVPPSASGTTSSRRCLTRSSVSSSCGEVVGITVTSAAVARVVDRSGRRTKATPVLAAEPRRERVDVASAAGVGQLGGDHQRAVGAGAEALGVQVVGLAGHRVGRVVAGVGEAEAHAERGRGEREQERGGGDRGRPRAPLDRVAPARGGRVAVALGPVSVPAEERDPQPVDLRARGRRAAPAAA